MAVPRSGKRHQKPVAMFPSRVPKFDLSAPSKAFFRVVAYFCRLCSRQGWESAMPKAAVRETGLLSHPSHGPRHLFFGGGEWEPQL